MIKNIFVLFIFVFISGCDDFKYLNAPNATYTVASDSDISDIEIVVNRLKEYTPSMFSEVKFDARTKEITFSKGAPDDEIIDYMSSNRGKFSIRKEGSFRTWVSNEHISIIQITNQDNQVSLLIRLTDAGGQLMSTLSEKNFGENLIVEIDGVVFLKAKITTKLDSYLKLSPADSSDILKKRILLQHGSLKNPVVLKKL